MEQVDSLQRVESPEVLISASELVTERIKSKSIPGHRNDPYKLGFVFEGGGMRAVRSSGMVIALETVDGMRAADAVYATSGGVGPAIYGLGGNMKENIASSWEDLNTKRYADIKRVFKGNWIDLDYLVWEVLSKKRPINWEGIRDSGIDLHIFMTEANSAEVVDVHKFESRDDLLKACYLACHLPVATGWPKLVGERMHMTDGGLVAGGLPLQAALEDGCTHVVCFSTKRQGEEMVKRSPIEPIAKKIIGTKFPNLARMLHVGTNKYNSAVGMIENSEMNPEVPPTIEALRVPDDSVDVSLLEKNKDALIGATMDGYKLAVKKFHLDTIEGYKAIENLK